MHAPKESNMFSDHLLTSKKQFQRPKAMKKCPLVFEDSIPPSSRAKFSSKYFSVLLQTNSHAFPGTNVPLTKIPKQLTDTTTFSTIIMSVCFHKSTHFMGWETMLQGIFQLNDVKITPQITSRVLSTI